MGKIEGLCRTVAMPVEVIGLIGWCGYVIGFSVTTAKKSAYNITANTTNLGHRLDYEYTCYWFFLVSGLLMNVFIIVHLHVAKWFTAVMMNFLVALCLAAGGAIIQLDGTYFFGLITSTSSSSASQYFQEPTIWILVEFIGACVAVLSLIVYMLLWPCISDSTECCNSSVAPSNDSGEVLLIRRGAQLAFEEQPPPRGKGSTNPTARPMEDSFEFNELHNSQARRSVTSSSRRQTQPNTQRMDSSIYPALSPSAPPMTTSEDRYLPKPSSSPLPQHVETDKESMTEEAPTEDTANLVHM